MSPTPLHLRSARAWSLALLAGLSACGSSANAPSAFGSDAADLHTVARDAMLITVRENGELKAAKETRIRSEIEGQTTLIFMEKEGQVVKEGQKLVELDVSDLREKRATQGIAVERAKASLEAGRQNLAILGKELASADAEARSELEIAGIDLEKFLGRKRREGGEEIAERITNADLVERVRKAVESHAQYAELPDKVAQLLTKSDGHTFLENEMGELGQQILEQVDQINIAQQKLALAKDTYEKSVDLEKDQYLSKNELEGDRLNFETQKSQVTIAWQKLDILISYTLRKTNIELGLKLDNAGLELEKVVASNAARRASQESDVGSKEMEFTLADERLKNFDEQISNAVIYAPNAGMVVSAEVDDRSRDVVQEGSMVRDRQTLLVLPDVTRMIAEVKVQESDVDKVRVGQLAVIQLEAFTDQVFTGRVSRVSPVADSGSRWMSSTRKVYKTWIDLDTNNEDGSLRPNMSAAVEIRVGTVPDAIAVPVSSVRRVDKHRYIWKATKSGPEAMEVKIGRATTTQVEILEGLAVGEQIYLAPPPGSTEPVFAEAPAEELAAPILPSEPESTMRVGDSGDPNPADGAGAPALAGDPVTRESFQAAIIQKHPELKEVLETEGFRAMRNEAVRAAIEGDPELAEMQARMMEQMRSQFGGQGGGRRGQGGGDPSGAGPGTGPGGQGGRRPRGEGGATPGARRDGTPRDGQPRDGE